MKIRDFYTNEGVWDDVKGAAKKGWTKGGPLAKADRALGKSHIAKKMGGWADKFNKKHGQAAPKNAPQGILPGQAMNKGTPDRPLKKKVR